jgi:3-phenylpropionate/trans-cinnamate dioxygenase ferredoxin subunit
VAVWVRVAEEGELGSSLGVRCEGRAIALFRLDDGVHALDDVCSHEYSLLSEGEIWDGEVFCVKHGSRFDIRSGEVKSLPAVAAVKRYEAKVEEGGIWVLWPGT